MTGPNRAELARLGLFWDALADAARERGRAVRAELTADAADEMRRQGAAPTWRIPGVGTVPLALSSPAVEVIDEAAYTLWVAERHPSEIETVRRVRAAFDKHLRDAAAKYGDPPCTAEGEVIPGLRYRPGGQPRGVQIRPEADAKRQAAIAAHAYLDLHQQQQLNGGQSS